MFISVNTASWSLTPGITLQAVNMLELFVMTRSRVLLPLVGVVKMGIPREKEERQ